VLARALQNLVKATYSVEIIFTKIEKGFVDTNMISFDTVNINLCHFPGTSLGQATIAAAGNQI
jgi:hypothetical protein